MKNTNAQSRKPPRGVTFEEVWASMQETDRQMKETDRRIKETSALSATWETGLATSRSSF
ncbi:MAG: hypothetical protein LBG27_00310 [Spirochaetaceae bacterium]|jgi:hypothetical protein|nr:hypothetical protein [Spirochaetaceae bacterium]